ncbi:YceI-like protein [Methylophaga frappieri]|uniref:YceI-like protein n=1 Tax=Methylophaga frappieri (strain ATCC BAA-2434 / DSM 25690 / JAM7) TaxID=754477 RepID=I1YJA3_METFJ|nr:YceI family protein [Methylophaga frappieri]AFJ02996.1 YceI-like protein [Methylophaga frappieri]
MHVLKKQLIAASLPLMVMFAMPAHASQCDFTPDKEGFDFSFTAFGAPDKSYVVSGNRFTKYEVASESGKLLNATIDIDASSLDTSHDLSNGMGGEWPDSIPPVRNENVVKNLFMNFVDPGTIQAKIVEIKDGELSLDVTMNGETRTVPMSYEVVDGKLQAKGSLDILDFNASEAFKKFEAVCTTIWHKGKTWSTVDLTFTVPVEEAGC